MKEVFIMKIVLNRAYGGYSAYDISEQFMDLVERCEDDRTNAELVNFVENNPNDCGDLKVINIPDTITDMDITDDDGYEGLIYVLNGKIHYI